jgi:hypothetical protein
VRISKNCPSLRHASPTLSSYRAVFKCLGDETDVALEEIEMLDT